MKRTGIRTGGLCGFNLRGIGGGGASFHGVCCGIWRTNAADIGDDSEDCIGCVVGKGGAEGAGEGRTGTVKGVTFPNCSQS